MQHRDSFLPFSTFISEGFIALRAEKYGLCDPWLAENHNTFAGQACFVLGNGPSLASIDPEVLSELPSFGTNGIFLKYLPTFYTTISFDYYKNYVEEIRGIHCKRKFIGTHLTEILTDFSDESQLNCNRLVYGTAGPVKFPVPLRFSRDASRLVYLGGTVLFVCLQIAFWLGFRKIVLLGVDHEFGFPRSTAEYGGVRLPNIGSEIHFSDKYSKPGYSPHCDVIATERSFRLARNVFDAAGGEILNATEDSKLPDIKMCSLNEALDRVSACVT